MQAGGLGTHSQQLLSHRSTTRAERATGCTTSTVALGILVELVVHAQQSPVYCELKTIESPSAPYKMTFFS